MNMTLSRIRHALGAAALAAGVLLAFAAQAQLDLAQSPLFLGQNVKPNIMLAVDDSGSMDSEILLPANDGASWWHTGRASFTGLNQADQQEPGVVNFNLAGGANNTWKKFTYLFPNGLGQSAGRRGYGDSTHDHYAVPPFGEFAYLRSPAFNLSYFDPSQDYAPWPDQGGLTFTDSLPTAAPTDPVLGSETYDLTAVQERTGGNHVFRLFPGMTIPSGTRYRDWSDGAWKNAPAPGGRSIVNDDMPNPCTGTGCTYTGPGRGVPVSFYPATFYLPESAAPAGFGYSATPAASGLAPDGELLYRYEIKPSNFSSPEAYDAAIGNFANWFTYYRKRHAAARGGIGAAFEQIRNFKVGAFTINNRVNPVVMRDLGEPADRDDFFGAVYGDFVNVGGTPNREAVNHMGLQLERSGSNAPIEYACQRNFGVLFTDGYSNVSTPRNVGNVDGSSGPPFADSYNNTLADLAMHYYQSNLRSDLPSGQVPVPASCNAANPDPSLDCRAEPHMNLFGITLGTQGIIFGQDEAATDDPFGNPPAWSNPTTMRNPVQVDDLWHATINSRGALLNVAVPSDLGVEFARLLGTIGDRITSSSAVAANSTRLDTETLIYQARFRSDDWTGQLLAYKLDTDGSLGTVEWDAADLIPSPANRNLFTTDGAIPGTGIPFLWEELAGAQQAALNQAPDGTTDGLGEQRVAWLRGEQAGGSFRNRSTLLGDIINSDPKFVGGQNFGYEALPVGTPGRDTYVAFRQSKVSSNGTVLDPMIYVGANDGMLHAFDAADGVEQFAYLPGTLVGELNELPDPDYQHRYYVDGQTFTGDAYIDRNGVERWASVLVGTTGAGGRTVFALDVTDPDTFAADDVLWEFTDPDLGHTIGEPVVARMQDDTWVAVFGNGYNSDDHRAMLFIVDLTDGTLLKKIDTGAGDAGSPNGLTTPSLLTDATRTVETIYAGDLLGNLWKFDVSQSNTNNWGADFAQGGSPAPLFVARDAAGNRQPITGPAEIGSHPEGGYMIYFGTGKFFESGDNLIVGDPQVQSFYGVWDKSGQNRGISYTAGDRGAVLTRQEILFEGSRPNTNFEVRVTSASPVDWDNERGWYIDLQSPVNGPEGERVVAAPILRGGRIIFPTLIPSPNPCGSGGTSWLMELEAISGSRLQRPPLDITEDGEINDDDNVTVTVTVDGETVTVNVAPSGLRSREGIIGTPAVISAGEVEYKLSSGTSGNVETLRERGIYDRARGSWRQIR